MLPEKYRREKRTEDNITNFKRILQVQSKDEFLKVQKISGRDTIEYREGNGFKIFIIYPRKYNQKERNSPLDIEVR